MFDGDIDDGTEVFDSDGHRIGKVGQVFVLEGTDRPTWVAVHTGLFGMQSSFVPVADAHMRGGELIVPYDKDFVKDAPRIGDDELTVEREAELYRYYGVEPPRHSSGGATAGGAAVPGGAVGAAMAAAAADRDADARRLDDQPHDERGHQDEHGHEGEHRRMDGSDEQGATGAAGAGAGAGAAHAGSGGAPRLRRRVITEMQTVQVPVQREEIIVEGDGIAQDPEDDRR